MTPNDGFQVFNELDEVVDFNFTTSRKVVSHQQITVSIHHERISSTLCHG